MSVDALAAAVRKARYDLRLTQLDVDDRGGPSVASLRNIEQGRFPGSLRRRTLASIDSVFGWPSGTAKQLLVGEIDAVPIARDSADGVQRSEAEERAVNDSGRRYGIDQVMAAINAETIPDLIDHASRRLRQALAVLMQAHADELAEVHAENARLRAALGRGAVGGCTAEAEPRRSSEPEAQTAPADAGAHVSHEQTPDRASNSVTAGPAYPYQADEGSISVSTRQSPATCARCGHTAPTCARCGVDTPYLGASIGDDHYCHTHVAAGLISCYERARPSTPDELREGLRRLQLSPYGRGDLT
jgi:hypothetical protein